MGNILAKSTSDPDIKFISPHSGSIDRMHPYDIRYDDDYNENFTIGDNTITLTCLDVIIILLLLCLIIR